MPDIDIDIQDNRRDEVIEYCIEKYGDDRVAHIVTFGKMAARNAIRDVSRVLEIPYAEADRLAKMVPPPVQGRHIPLAVSSRENRELREEYESNETSRRIMDLAVRLEGTIRSHGVHAAGVVIAPEDIVNFTPLEMAQKGVIATQYSMYPIEELGLLKIDFLGLSNLTTIKNALRIVKKVWDKGIDISTIPLDDKAVFELFGRGETIGVFQLESGGMKRVLKNLQPNTFEDVLAAVAMYRPGPMQFIDSFIARKHGQEKIDYLHPSMKSALENTYGKLIYQEQVMQIAKDMCGFSGGQADTLRKAIGKKDPALLAKMKRDFVEGGIKHSQAERKLMEDFWVQLEEFAAYCFNKAHAASYGLIAYQTAYLKAHYPQAFMASLMTTDFNDTDRLAIDINECHRLGIEVLPPDINESFLEFGVVPKTLKIRFGMAAIKNVGTAVVEEILEARDKGGPFKSIGDFVARVSAKAVNRKTMESLIKAGAFDRFAERAVLLHNLDKILAHSTKLHKETQNGQIDLFADSSDGSRPAHELELSNTGDTVPESEILKWERELLGLYLSRHPLDQLDDLLEERAVPIEKLSTDMDGRRASIGGVVQRIKEVNTRNGAKMAFVTVEDKTGEMEAILFPDNYNKMRDIWQLDNIVIASGKLSSKDRSGNQEELKLLVDTAEHISSPAGYKKTGKKMKPPRSKKPDTAPQNETATPGKLYLMIRDPSDDKLLKQIKTVLSRYGGASQAILVLGESKQNAVKLPFGVKLSAELEEELATLLGAEAVAVKNHNK